jgi:predicted MFS family arabinose efflux permease
LFLSALIGFYPITTALSPSVEWLLPAAVIWGICVAAIDIGVVDMLLAACPKGRQPTFIAVANVLASVENFTGPLIGAALAEAIGVPEALLAAGALQVVSGVFFLLFPSRDEERRERLAAAQAVQPES